MKPSRIINRRTRRAAWPWRGIALAGGILLSALLAGCAQGRSETDQSKMCIFSNDAQAKKCTTGQLAFYSPDSWGNEQLPLNVIAVYCNTNDPVFFNKAGVICTFTDKRLFLLNASAGSQQ